MHARLKIVPAILSALFLTSNGSAEALNYQCRRRCWSTRQPLRGDEAQTPGMMSRSVSADGREFSSCMRPAFLR